jgi:hypothetical protein
VRDIIFFLFFLRAVLSHTVDSSGSETFHDALQSSDPRPVACEQKDRLTQKYLLSRFLNSALRTRQNG